MTESLTSIANKVRKLSLVGIYHAKSGHPGGCLSCADLISYIFVKCRYENKNKTLDDYNPFILSKGHACPALYAIAACLKIIPEDDIYLLRKINSKLQGHPSVISLPFVEASTGSLGQGLSVGVGMALGYKHKKIYDKNVFVMIGDGELQEGEVWEAFMFSSNYKLNNLCVILDYNKMQSDDLNENIIKLEPLKEKLEAFGWHAQEIDGHDLEEIDKAFSLALNEKNKPSIIISNTIKGKGVSFMEGKPSWHGSVQIKPEELEIALKDLGTSNEEIFKYMNIK